MLHGITMQQRLRISAHLVHNLLLFLLIRIIQFIQRHLTVISSQGNNTLVKKISRVLRVYMRSLYKHPVIFTFQEIIQLDKWTLN
jgi:hypothetical protein